MIYLVIILNLKINNNNISIINASKFKKRLLGLMGKTNISYGMFFTYCNSVHTFFMKENIDIIALNLEQEIIFIKENCPKNKIIKIKNSHKKTHILELPKNMSKALKIGDKINFN